MRININYSTSRRYVPYRSDGRTTSVVRRCTHVQINARIMCVLCVAFTLNRSLLPNDISTPSSVRPDSILERHNKFCGQKRLRHKRTKKRNLHVLYDVYFILARLQNEEEG